MLIVYSNNSEWTTVEGKSMMALICSEDKVLFNSDFQLDLIWPPYIKTNYTQPSFSLTFMFL